MWAADLDPVGAEDLVEVGQSSLLPIGFPDQAGEEIPDQLVYRRVSVDRGFAGGPQERVIKGQCDILLHITSVPHNLWESGRGMPGPYELS
jgi:hypothetical protein